MEFTSVSLYCVFFHSSSITNNIKIHASKFTVSDDVWKSVEIESVINKIKIILIRSHFNDLLLLIVIQISIIERVWHIW